MPRNAERRPGPLLDAYSLRGTPKIVTSRDELRPMNLSPADVSPVDGHREVLGAMTYIGGHLRALPTILAATCHSLIRDSHQLPSLPVVK